MAERKKTPDILADLLGTVPPSTSIATTKNDGKTVRQQNSKTAESKAVKTVKRQDSNPSFLADEETDGLGAVDEAEGAIGKIKVTFYLSEDAVELLEDTQRHLRRRARRNGNAVSKAATSKSALLEAALKLACNEYEERGDKSRFAGLTA